MAIVTYNCNEVLLLGHKRWYHESDKKTRATTVIATKTEYYALRYWRRVGIYFNVSVPTIRLDRLELGIPELRERIKSRVDGLTPSGNNHSHIEVVGELIDLTAGEQGLSILRTTDDMTDSSGYVEPQYLYAQADSLAKAVLGIPLH